MARATLPFLLRHEIRLGWRALSGKQSAAPRRFSVPAWAIAVGAIVLVGILAGVPLARFLAGIDLTPTPLGLAIAGVAVLAVFPLMLSSTLLVAVQVLYERGDLDLLLSSPLSPVKVLTIRAFGMAFNVAIVFVALLTPFLVPIALWGHPQLLGIYAVGIALSLVAAAAGLALARLLFGLIGPRRTKTVAQVGAALIGASFAIVANIPNFMGQEQAAAFWSNLVTGFLTGEIALPDWVAWPIRAVFGEILPLLVVLAFAGAVFTLASVRIGRRFAENAAAAKGADSGRVRTSVRARKFRGGVFASMVRKELTLIRRDGGLLSHVLLRVIYFIPLAFVMIRNAEEAPEVSLAIGAGAIVFMTNQLAGALSWITISAEDSPQLLAAAPVRPWLVWRAKLTAAAIPLLIIVAAPLVAIIALNPLTGLISAAGCAVAATTSGLINIWRQAPGKREEIRKKYGPSPIAIVLDIASGAAWAAATGFAVYGNWPFAAVAVVIGAVLVATARRPEQAILDRVTGAA